MGHYPIMIQRDPKNTAIAEVTLMATKGATKEDAIAEAMMMSTAYGVPVKLVMDDQVYHAFPKEFAELVKSTQETVLEYGERLHRTLKDHLEKTPEQDFTFKTTATGAKGKGKGRK